MKLMVMSWPMPFAGYSNRGQEGAEGFAGTRFVVPNEETTEKRCKLPQPFCPIWGRYRTTAPLDITLVRMDRLVTVFLRS